MSSTDLKIQLDTAKFSHCVSGYDFMAGGLSSPDMKSAVFAGLSNQDRIRYGQYEQQLQKSGQAPSERLLAQYASNFMFYVNHVDCQTCLNGQFVTGYDMQKKIGSGDFSWIFIGSDHHQRDETRSRMRFLSSLDALAKYDLLTNYSEMLGQRKLDETEALEQLNLTRAKLKEFRELVKKTPMWKVGYNECSDFSAKAGIPSWFGELLSRFGAKQQPQLDDVTTSETGND